MTQKSTHPSSDVELFSDEALVNPYPHHERLRDAVVQLHAPGAFALSRYAEVRGALADWRTFSSRGVGSTEDWNEAVTGTTILASEPPLAPGLGKRGVPLDGERP